MPIIVNNQPQLGKTTEYRLSIQADLNGFSFSVINDKQGDLLFLYSSDFLMEREDMDLFVKRCTDLFNTMPILRSNYKRVNLIWGTEKYSPIPRSIHKGVSELEVLGGQHKLDDLDEINTIEVEHERMTLIFAVNSTFVNMVKIYQPEFRIFPLIYVNLIYLPLFEEYNKISFHYIKGAVTISVSEGKRIIYCNSFPAYHFNSALYFLLLVLKEVQFNPESTTVFVSGNIRDLEMFDIAKYFSRVKYFRNPSAPLPDQLSELKYSSLTFDI
jgi:hypothetical protein